MMAEESNSLEYTPTWVVAVVCFVIVLMSLFAERALHKLGKWLNKKKQEALFEALQKLKEELMLLGFISLLLTVTQNAISRICIPPQFASVMLPCKRETESRNHGEHFHQALNSRRRLLSASSNAAHCSHEGTVQLFSLEALHQLHIFIFVLAVVHVIFCASTMVLGGARIRQWKAWEKSIWSSKPEDQTKPAHEHHHRLFQHHHNLFFEKHAKGHWRKSVVISWLISFFKHFFGSITKSDYIALRHGFITQHCPHLPQFDFHEYILRTLEIDFKKIVGISWHLWLFVVIFLLLNVEGWHTYFWLAFLPLVLLLLVGAKLEHIITCMAQEADEKMHKKEVKPSDNHFWFHNPVIMLHLIHFILFQNSFEIAFFFWIWSTYGFRSCIMEKLGFIIPRLIMGLIVQVLCSYSTLPLYALVSQMGTNYKRSMFSAHMQSALGRWAHAQADPLTTESSETVPQEMHVIEPTAESVTQHSIISPIP
ncbi:MLO-like protein 13 isoform X2 [Ricinus communis]|uniref:MLO-like protein 13 isoform X2 n=1 Tax=Ricinus communis TaxID=3988 RepID=UPI00201A79E1|nr:MLO-like protein 13 isoform X2 [Ricinus communis]